MNVDLDRLCSAAQQPAYAYALKVTSEGAGGCGAELEAIVRAVLTEMKTMSVHMLQARVSAENPGFIWGDVIDRILEGNHD